MKRKEKNQFSITARYLVSGIEAGEDILAPRPFLWHGSLDPHFTFEILCCTLSCFQKTAQFLQSYRQYQWSVPSRHLLVGQSCSGLWFYLLLTAAIDLTSN
jgi:hypothetical protein